MDDVIDSLQIEIESNATNAGDQIDKLVRSIRKLDKLGQNAGLVTLRTNLKKLTSLDFSSLQSQLTSIADSLKSITSLRGLIKNTSLVGDNNTNQQIITPQIELEDEGSITGVRSALQGVREEAIETGEAVRSSNATVEESFTAPQTKLEVLQERIIATRKKVEDLGAAYMKTLSELGAEDPKTNKAYLSVLAAQNQLLSYQEQLEKLQYDMGINANNETQNGIVAMGEVAATSSMELGELSTKLEAVERLADLTAQRAQILGQEWQETLAKFGASDIRTINAEIAFRNAEKSARSLQDQVEILRKKLEELSNPAPVDNGLKKLFNSIKRIALYRLVRSIISHAFNAIKEGIQNIAQYSEEAAKTMSELTSATGTLKNAFGAALMPAIKAVSPLIVSLCNDLTNLLNGFASVSAWLSGDDTYIKAIKYNKEYADSLKKIKQSQLGIDELNIIGENSSSNSADVSEMFETAKVESSEVLSTITTTIVALGTLATLLAVFKGTAIVDFFKKAGAAIKGFGANLKGLSKGGKAAISIALLATEALVAYDAFSGAVEGTKSWGTALLEFIPITIIVGAAMTAMLGPVGAILTAIVAVIAAVAGVIKAKNELKRKALMEKFWKAEGVAISEVTKMLDKYARNLGIMEQKEWNETLETTSDTLIDMARDYDALWDSLSKTKNLDSSKIDKLVKSFNALADAAMEVNKAAIGSLMNNIRMGIEMNITPELTARLEGLIGSLEAAQDLLNVKVQGIKAEYQALLNEIATNGGNITEEQRAKLNEMRSQIDTFTLTDNTSSEVWAVNLQQAIEKGISAGTDQESIKSNINDLTAQRDDYLETLKQAYGSSVSTLKQLIELDKNEFGGALGFKDSDLDTLEENYKAQIAQVNSQFNSVLDAIINSFSNNAIKHDELPGYKPESGDNKWGNIWDNFSYGFLKGITFGGYKSGEEKAYNEQQEFLEWLKGLKGYASGGYPEDDSLIYVNPYELVGKMSNGKNVVANNEMITEGIRRATYEAMVEANRENGNNGGGNAENLEIKVYLDGRQISATVEKNKRTKGVGETIYKGGVLNGI